MDITNSTEKAKPQKEVFLFIMKLVAIWLSWKGISYVLGEERIPLNERMFPVISAHWELLNNMMRHLVLNGAEMFVNIFGFDSENTGYALRIIGYRGVGVGNYCLGFQLMYYFTMLILVTPLKHMQKLFAITTGIPVIIILNIFRITAVCFIAAFNRSLLPLTHDYIFNFIVLGVLFAYYLVLIRKNKP